MCCNADYNSQQDDADNPAVGGKSSAASDGYPQKAESPDLGPDRHALFLQVVFDIAADIPLAKERLIEPLGAVHIANSRQKEKRRRR